MTARRSGGSSGWQAAALARLNAAEGTPSELPKKADDDEEGSGFEGPTLEDVEKEMEELQRKLESEKASISEARALLLNRSTRLTDAVAHAKRDKGGAEHIQFFLTSVEGDTGVEPSKPASFREKYPHYNREVRLAKEDAALKQIAKLKESTAQPLGKGSGVPPLAKSRGARGAASSGQFADLKGLGGLAPKRGLR
jgi:hypothetical protein